MIKICCLYFLNTDEEYKKPMYTTDYVEKLYNGLKKNCKVDFEFICYSDTPVVADRVIPLPKRSATKRQMDDDDGRRQTTTTTMTTDDGTLFLPIFHEFRTRKFVKFAALDPCLD